MLSKLPSKDKTTVKEKSDIWKIVRIGFLGILLLFFCALLFFGFHIYSSYKSLKEAQMQFENNRLLEISQLDSRRVVGVGKTFDLGLLGCKLYQSSSTQNDWQEVDLPYSKNSYPALLTACQESKILIEDEFFLVYICEQAIGAGGGCARGGTFRTSDGVNWLRRVGDVNSKVWTDTDQP